MVKPFRFNPESQLGMQEGRDFERNLFSDVRVDDPQYQERLIQLVRKYGERRIPFNELAELIENFQADDPINPSKEFSRDLRLEVAEKLGYEGEDIDRVKIFGALKTPLDIQGADGFISIQILGKKIKRVTLDGTLNQEKLSSGGRADVVFGGEDLPAPVDPKYLKAVDDIANQVIIKLNLRDKKQNPRSIDRDAETM